MALYVIRGWGFLFKIKKKYQSWLQNVERAKQDLLAALKVLDAHLLTRTFLVTERVTLADIVVFCTLIHAFQVTRAPSAADVDVCVCAACECKCVCCSTCWSRRCARGCRAWVAGSARWRRSPPWPPCCRAPRSAPRRPRRPPPRRYSSLLSCSLHTFLEYQNQLNVNSVGIGSHETAVCPLWRCVWRHTCCV